MRKAYKPSWRRESPYLKEHKAEGIKQKAIKANDQSKGFNSALVIRFNSFLLYAFSFMLYYNPLRQMPIE